MLNSSVLEVGIGLIFIYLLASLVCTAVAELIATVMRTRATTLKEGLRELLNEGDQRPDWAGKLLTHPLVYPLYDGRLSTSKDGTGVMDVLGRAWNGGATGPSYVPSHTFAAALTDLVFKAAQPLGPGGLPVTPADRPALSTVRTAIAGGLQENQPLQAALLTLVNEAGNDLRETATDLTKFQDQVEIWFNDSMERVSGWYKRRTQLLLLLIALVVTAILNVDTFAIVRMLSTNDRMRVALAAQAERYVADHNAQALLTAPAAPTTAANTQQIADARQAVEARIDRLAQTGLQLGWKRPTTGTADDLEGFGWIEKILGLLITTLAVSLGAPFWFDLLNKFIAIRGAGKAPEERPKDPRAVQQPLAAGQTPPPPANTGGATTGGQTALGTPGPSTAAAPI